jgi:hypothetical protein
MGNLSSRAAMISCRGKLVAEAAWGRLAGVPSGSGRLAIGLPAAPALPEECQRRLPRYVGQPILAAAAFQAALSEYARVVAPGKRQTGNANG